jgi:hypothetical protein
VKRPMQHAFRLPLLLLLFAFVACSPEQAVDVTIARNAAIVDTAAKIVAISTDDSEGDSERLRPEAMTVEAAKKLLESQGYFVAKDVEVLDRPVGFPEKDEFPLEPHEFSEKDGGAAQEACKVITKREAPEEWYKPIYAYCRWRVKNSSRAWQLGKLVESKVDGTPVHDRDRSSAHYFYGIAVKTGRMNPKACPHHRLPSLHVEHPPECIHLSQNYEERFKVPLDPERRTGWLKSTHAAEQFGARGPVDWNAYHGYKAIGGCYPFAVYDRTDVAVTAVVRRSAKICAKYGCDNVNTTKYIRPHWNEAI